MLGPSEVCLNAEVDFDLQLNNTRADSIRWRMPFGAINISDTTEKSIKILYRNFPKMVDSIVVVAKSGCGLLRGSRKLILADGCEKLFIPNIITPTTSDDNAIWDIRGLVGYPNFELLVFNTWGAQVHRQANSYTPWQGKSNGDDLPSATYYYVLKLGSGAKPITGSITVVR